MFDRVAFKKYIDDNGIKQAFIAQKLNLSEATFSAIVTGRVKFPLEAYVELCRLLRVPFRTFIADPDTAA